MALTKICGPRRVVLCYVLPGGTVVKDPALAPDMDAKAYAESMFDEALVKLREGQQATWFTIKCLTKRQREQAPEEPSALADWYIRCGVKKVDGYQRLEEDGRVTGAVVDLQPEGDLGPIATKKLLDDLDLDDLAKYALFGIIRELGQVTAGPLAMPSARQPGPGA